MRWLLTACIALNVSLGWAQSSVPTSGPLAERQAIDPQLKIDDFLKLLQDRDVRRWIEAKETQRNEANDAARDHAPFAYPAASVSSSVMTWEAHARRRVRTVVSAIPEIIPQVSNAVRRLRGDITRDGYAPLITFSSLVLAGTIVEWLFRKKWWRHGDGFQDYLPIAIFAVIMTMLFLAIAWPPSVRLVAACYLTAFGTYRLIAAVIRHVAPLEVHGRLKLSAGLCFLVAASTSALMVIDIEVTVLNAIVVLASCVILILAVELVWSTVPWRPPALAALSLYLTWIWLLWIAGLPLLFWLGIYIIVLPVMLSALSRSIREYLVRSFRIQPSDSRSVVLVRAGRALILILGLIWIALVWESDMHSFGREDLRAGTIFYGLLKSVFVLLLADLLWNLAKAAINRNLTSVHHQASPDDPAEPGLNEARGTRLETLLPILRNVLSVAIAVITGLAVLGQLGVDIAPLIAGAGIFGVAIGFGSQALVRDVISGFFYLFDDAFRVGEYIQAKSYKGTVEGFSLRSVRLRHHRGPIFTVPFGELGAVENMSRDWSKIKFVITVPYDTNLEKARKIAKSIGQNLLEDPEFGSLFIQPLKLKGVEEFGEYGIKVSFAMVTVPTNQQSFIRRTAFAKLRDAFQDAGITFAQPTVQVGSTSLTEAAAASIAHRNISRSLEAESPA